MKLVKAFLCGAFLSGTLCADDVNMIDFFEGKSSVQIPVGEKLSIHSEIKVNVDQPFFVKCTGEEFLFSFDEQTWLPFVEIFTGNIGVVPFFQGENLHLNVNFDVERRDQN